ncbi:MAG: metallophosphoesterase [Cellulomonadaceae bacterium]|jgi:predicted MPP superfamily phosphohydrolase|nr:metallophosphoesterase [Cellulomonadaceae bacterium]
MSLSRPAAAGGLASGLQHAAGGGHPVVPQRHLARRRRWPWFALGALGLVAVLFFAFDARLSTRQFNITSPKLNGTTRLVAISDLHSCSYGKGQQSLLDAIAAVNPAGIVLTGDIYDDRLPRENTDITIEALTASYPVYYVSGNHEFWSRDADGFKASLEAHGVHVLEGTSEILNINNAEITIAGIDDPETDRYPSRSIPYQQQLSALNTASDDSRFTILLAHRPERISEYLPLRPDLVLSGHAHGGQWRIPFLLENGVFAPNQGMFPRYTNGIFHFDGSDLIVSRGLARESTRVPRIFNRPELIVITLEPQA